MATSSPVQVSISSAANPHAPAGRSSLRMSAQCLVGEDLTHSHKIGIVLETGPCGRKNSGALTTSPVISSATLPKASDNPVALSGAL